MSLTLGEKLRQAREERGISLAEVAEQTRISPLYIESIENDNYKPLPGGIFNKGFVRSYAKYVGLNEHEALRDYAQIAAATELEQPEPPRSYRPEVLTDDRPGTSTLQTVLFAGVIVALIVAGALFLVRYTQSPEPLQITSNTQSNTAPASPAPVPPESIQPPAANAPALEGSKIEFRAAGQPVWLRAVVDGKSSEMQIEADKSVVFEPKDSLRLSYSRSRAEFAMMSINSKSITLPSEPASANKGTIEFELNRENFAEVWQSGKTMAGVISPGRENNSANRAFAPTRPKPSPSPGSTPSKPLPTPTRPLPGAAARPTPR